MDYIADEIEDAEAKAAAKKAAAKASMLAALAAKKAAAKARTITDIGYWRYADLLDLKFVGSRSDLKRKKEFEGFPQPYKNGQTMQASALYSRAEVIAWDVARRARLREQSETREAAE